LSPTDSASDRQLSGGRTEPRGLSSSSTAHAAASGSTHSAALRQRTGASAAIPRVPAPDSSRLSTRVAQNLSRSDRPKQRAVYANRRPVRGEYGRSLLRRCGLVRRAQLRALLRDGRAAALPSASPDPQAGSQEEKRREQLMQIGEPLRTIVVEPLHLSVKQPAGEPEPIQSPESEPQEVPVTP
jgi:hypothetical protein